MKHIIKNIYIITCASVSLFCYQVSYTKNINKTKFFTSKAQPWRPVQEQVRDTVVQIFSHIAALDIFQPYKTPDQYGASGTGFFIDDQGYIITNAHVVDQAQMVVIQIPSLGKQLLPVDIVGVCPERDLALIRVTEEGRAYIKEHLGSIPYLSLGDSDSVHRADEVMALGYPLGQQSLKSTAGLISGYELNMLQISAPINPGNSGGPLLNTEGKVIGINSAGVTSAQNVGYAIPVNDLKIILTDLYTISLLKKPFLGILSQKATYELTDILGNPQPGGCYVLDVVKDSILAQVGVQSEDMIYEINGHKLDIYGEMTVPWSEDKVSIINYINRISTGETIDLVVYRKGERKEFSLTFDHAQQPPIHMIYPHHEKIDYEVFAGMVIMNLTLNHIKAMANDIPGLRRYAELAYQQEPVLVITHIFQTSHLFQARTFSPGFILREINGMQVKTMDDLRAALQNSKDEKYFTLKAIDTISCSSENMIVVLPRKKVLEQETKLSQMYHYPLSDTIKSLLENIY